MEAFELRLPGVGRRTSRVVVGPGATARLIEEGLPGLEARILVVVSDSTVAPLHGEPLCHRLRALGHQAHLLVFPAGEVHKTRETKAALEDRLLELGAGRDTVILAVGGGVTGDLAGFLAATWHRGVPVVQVPTTLLAMADSALGGKTAVNLRGGKNLVGAFHPPAGIYADLETLSTLPDAELLEGFSEIVKSAAVADATLFADLERGTGDLRRRDLAALERAVAGSLRIKARVVSRDERERGIRAALNFGHTIGHALEAATGFGGSHGRAVAVGLAVEGRIATRVTGLPAGHAQRIETLLRTLGLPTEWPRGLDPSVVLEATRRDKKSRGGRVRYALPERIGRMPKVPGTTVEVPDHVAREIVEAHLCTD